MQFDVRHIEIPFRFRYGHKLKQHRGVQAIICLATDDGGRVGLGEAVPRDYVTGETCESVMAAIEPLAKETIGQGGFEQQVAERTKFASEWSGAFPSCAMCALDLARSDLAARNRQQSIRQWWGGGAGKVERYCASIGFGSGWKGRAKLALLMQLYKRLGFRKFKVKVGNDDDELRVRFVRSQLGADVEIFADANTAWDRETAIRKIDMLARHSVWAIEEPLQIGSPATPRPRWGNVAPVAEDRLQAIDEDHLANVAWLRERSPIPLIADESLICVRSLERILTRGCFDILNIRLSKCGGPMLSIHMAQRAQQAGKSYSVAAMVGETPILAVAGAQFAAMLEKTTEAPRYVQGFSHGLLHRVKIVRDEPKLKGAAVQLTQAAGLGLSLDMKRLDSVTKARIQFDA